VALAFGRSNSYPDGKYFAGWHVQFQNWWGYDYEGQIYTSFTPNQYNGTWMAPIRVDTLVANGSGKCKHLSIACQINDLNNNSSGISSVILFERLPWMPMAGYNGIVGVYNLNPVQNPVWTPLTLESLDNTWSMQPDITFDPGTNNFFATWCDSTNQKLKTAYQSFELPSPSNWNILSNGYNDTTNLKAPFPRVKSGVTNNLLAHVWSGNQYSGNGNATFDGATLWMALPIDGQPEKLYRMSLSPNPAKDFTELSFESESTSKGVIAILSLSGSVIQNLREIDLKKGKNKILLDLTRLPSGIYYCSLVSGNIKVFDKIVIIK
jgi:hypothetical protein